MIYIDVNGLIRFGKLVIFQGLAATLIVLASGIRPDMSLLDVLISAFGASCGVALGMILTWLVKLWLAIYVR